MHNAMKKILIIALLGVCTISLKAQNSNFTISYPISIPMGDLGDFISKPSFRGINMDYRYSFQPNLAIGFNLGWNTFYEEKDRDVYTIDNTSLSGKQFRYSNHAPMLATITYFIGEDELFKPYGTLGIGTMYTRRNTDMNLYTLEQEAWNFAIQPEFGVQYRASDHAGVVLSLKYMYGTAAGSELTEAQSFLAINIGFSFY
jgi:hypothetical protein